VPGIGSGTLSARSAEQGFRRHMGAQGHNGDGCGKAGVTGKFWGASWGFGHKMILR
jgi:hypothetical protein